MELNPSVILFALLALEKFAQTSTYPGTTEIWHLRTVNVILNNCLILVLMNLFTGENKWTINIRLAKENHRPLELLEKWLDHDDYICRQVGFCGQWCLDNLCEISLMYAYFRSLEYVSKKLIIFFF